MRRPITSIAPCYLAPTLILQSLVTMARTKKSARKFLSCSDKLKASQRAYEKQLKKQKKAKGLDKVINDVAAGTSYGDTPPASPESEQVADSSTSLPYKGRQVLVPDEDSSDGSETLGSSDSDQATEAEILSSIASPASTTLITREDLNSDFGSEVERGEPSVSQSLATLFPSSDQEEPGDALSSDEVVCKRTG